jgi:hypothetical protein
MMEQDALLEMYEAATSQDDSDWTCYCGNETVRGNVMPEHTVSEHNAVGYAADQCPDHGNVDCWERDDEE